MAQLIIDTAHDGEQDYRAVVAFCNAMLGEETHTFKNNEVVGDISKCVEISGSSSDLTEWRKAFEDWKAMSEDVDFAAASQMMQGSLKVAHEAAEGHSKPMRKAVEEAVQQTLDDDDSLEIPGNTVIEYVDPYSEDDGEPVPTANRDNLDSEGLPWDKRIHSGSKKTVADGTWRKRQKPKDMNDEQWSDFIDVVKGELRQAISGEPIVAPEPEADEPNGHAVFGGVAMSPDAAAAFGGQPGSQDGTPVVRAHAPAPQPAPAPVEAPAPAPVEAPAPAPVEAPAPAPAPVEAPAPAGDNEQQRQFPEVMQLITANNDVLTKDFIQGILNGHGLANLPMLRTAEEARPGIITTVYNELESYTNG